MERRIVVAVDGPAGSGKSSVSREVAVRLKLKYIDSGALYRSVTWFFLQNHPQCTPDVDYGADLQYISIHQDFQEDGSTRTWVNGKDVSSLIRDEKIAANIGPVSDARSVRDFVNRLLRKWALKESIIMDGRDIGTVVFPDADLKIFLDASVEERTSRRMNEYKEMGKNVDEKTIKNQIIQRDQQDRSRPFGALERADDAVYLETSDMNRDQVVSAVSDLITRLQD